MRSIAVATDFSSCARQAVHWAAELAAAHHARLLLVHAVTWPAPSVTGSISGAMPEMPAVAAQVGRDAEARARERLDAFAETLRSRGLRVETSVGGGPPVSVVLDAAAYADADLVVTGTHGRTGLRSVLLGSTAAALVQESRIPVLTVRDGTRTEAHGPVLAATDFSPDADCALTAMAALLEPLAKLTGVVLLHAYHNPMEIQTGPDAQLPEDLLALADAVRRRLERTAGGLRRLGFAVETLALETAAPAETIAQTARELDASLTVLGAAGGSGLRHLLRGHTTPQVLPRVCAAVLTAHAAETPRHRGASAG